MNFPLRIAFPVFHRFWIVVSSFSFVSRYLLIFPWPFVSFFFLALLCLSLLWSLLFPSFYSLWALFIIHFQVSLSMLDFLFGLFLVFRDRPIMLWVSLLGLLLQCPMDFGLLCPHFHLFQGIFWFLPWSCCWPTDCWTPIAKGSLSLGFKAYFVRLSTAKNDTKDRWIQGLVLWKDERDWQTFGQAHQEKKRRPK